MAKKKRGGNTKVYTPEEKAKSLKLIEVGVARGQTVKEACGKIGLPVGTHRSWLRQAKRDAAPAKPAKKKAKSSSNRTGRAQRTYTKAERAKVLVQVAAMCEQGMTQPDACR